MRKVAIGCLIVLLALVAVIAICRTVYQTSRRQGEPSLQDTAAVSAVRGQRVYCSKTSANVRVRPGSNAQIAGKMNLNESYEVVSSELVGETNWYCIKFGDSTGWVHSSVIEFHPIEPDWSRDLKVIDSSWSMSEYVSMASWTVRVRNKSQRYCYKDLLFDTYYAGESGTLLSGNTMGHTEYVILKPGQVRTLKWDDIMAHSQSRKAAVSLVNAEPVDCP
jgi:uncharacterized protein YgiM (DUF1202 family)